MNGSSGTASSAPAAEDDKIDHIKHFNVATGLMERPPPSRALLTTLANLASDKKNTVFIVSGKERKDLARALGATAKLGLAAEHGLFFRWPQYAGGADDRGAHAGGLDGLGLYCWCWWRARRGARAGPHVVLAERRERRGDALRGGAQAVQEGRPQR